MSGWSAGGVVIAGGGTGGHLFPGLALADALVARGVGITFVGTSHGLEARAVPAAGYPLRLLAGGQLRGGGPKRAVAALAATASGVRGATALLRELRPRLIVGVGGYASVAVVLAGRLRRLPILLLEQNVVPGAANRLLGRLARRVCVGFAESIPFFPRERALHTGNPLRAGVLAAAGERSRTAGRLGLLVYGGSQGARQLNRATVEALRILGPEAGTFVITHQTGTADVDEVRAGYGALGIQATVVPFIDDMGAAYAAADLVVGRAGAMTCAEVTALGLPAVLVPYPHAADDHQRRNAEVLAGAGAAELILDHELNGERLATTLRRFAAEPDRRATMAAHARALGRPDAAVRVADECARWMLEK